jgi:hypothetical protein
VTRRLGRLPHSPARLAAVPPHTFAADAPPPPVVDRSGIAFAPGLWRNDVLPDCTAVGLANARRAATLIQGYDIPTDEGQIIAFYAACAGVADIEAALEASDGAVMLDVLERAQRDGFQMGGQTPEVPTFAAIQPTDRAGLAHAIAVHGAAYIGIDLYEPDMAADAIWTLPPAGALVGGHALIAWSYSALGNADMVMLGTWGDLVAASWAWLEGRAQEAFALSWA